MMKVLTDTNHKSGRHSIHLAAEGVNKYQPWKMRSTFKSPYYTTNWHDIPVVYAN